MSSPRRSLRLENKEPENTGLIYHRSQNNSYGHSTIETISFRNAAATAYSAVDWLSMGALTDTVETMSTMASHNPSMSWGEAVGLRGEATARWGVRMVGRAAIMGVGGSLLGGVGGFLTSKLGSVVATTAGGSLMRGLAGSAIGQAYNSVSDRIATSAVTDYGGGFLEQATRGYYRLAHGEEIKTTGWESPTTASTARNNEAMGLSASEHSGGISHGWSPHDSRQWLHHTARSMGGKSEERNLTAGSRGANIAMTPGETVIKEAHRKGRNAEVSTTMFVRPGTNVGKRIIFRGKVDGAQAFNHAIDSNRWAVTRAEHKRMKEASSPDTQWRGVPASIQAYVPSKASMKKIVPKLKTE